MITNIRLVLTIILTLFYMPQSERDNVVIEQSLDADLPFILGWSEGKKAVFTTNAILSTSYLLLTLYASV